MIRSIALVSMAALLASTAMAQDGTPSMRFGLSGYFPYIGGGDDGTDDGDDDVIPEISFSGMAGRATVDLVPGTVSATGLRATDRIEVTGLPFGLSWVPNTDGHAGTIVGRSDTSREVMATARVLALDGTTLTTEQLPVVIHPMLSVEVPPSIPVTAGEAFSLSPEVEGVIESAGVGARFALGGAAKPDWLDIDEFTGQLSGEPVAGEEATGLVMTVVDQKDHQDATSSAFSFEILSVMPDAWFGKFSPPFTGATGVAVAGDGSTFVSGRRPSDTGRNDDISVVKVTSSGTVAWARSVGTQNPDVGKGVATTPDGGVVLLGDSSHSTIIAKLTASGDLAWSTQIGTMHTDGVDIAVGADGSIYVAAEHLNSAQLFKFSASGTLEWQRSYKDPSGITYAMAVAVASDGDVLIAAHTYVSAADGRIHAVKISPTGAFRYAVTGQRGGSKKLMSMVAGIAPAPGGGAYLVGRDSFTGVVVYKLDSAGAMVWGRDFKSDWSTSVWDATASSDGGVIFSGSARSSLYTEGYNDFYSAKVSGSGSISWAQAWGGPENQTISAAKVYSGKIYAAGYSNTEALLTVIPETGPGLLSTDYPSWPIVFTAQTPQNLSVATWTSFTGEGATTATVNPLPIVSEAVTVPVTGAEMNP